MARADTQAAAQGGAMMRLTVPRLGALIALAFFFVAGYFLAGLWWSARDTSPLAQICARVDYANSLEKI
jgi:apolipoprotein N-acyltransferase